MGIVQKNNNVLAFSLTDYLLSTAAGCLPVREFARKQHVNNLPLQSTLYFIVLPLECHDIIIRVHFVFSALLKINQETAGEHSDAANLLRGKTKWRGVPASYTHNASNRRVIPAHMLLGHLIKADSL